MKRRKTCQHKSRNEEERNSSRQFNETLWCDFWIEWVICLYRDFVYVLAKIATTVTLIDKIKNEVYPLISSTTGVNIIKTNKSTKVEQTNYWIWMKEI